MPRHTGSQAAHQEAGKIVKKRSPYIHFRFKTLQTFLQIEELFFCCLQ